MATTTDRFYSSLSQYETWNFLRRNKLIERRGRDQQAYYSGKSLSWMSPSVVCSVAELLMRELPEDCMDDMYISSH